MKAADLTVRLPYLAIGLTFGTTIGHSAAWVLAATAFTVSAVIDYKMMRRARRDR